MIILLSKSIIHSDLEVLDLVAHLAAKLPGQFLQKLEPVLASPTLLPSVDRAHSSLALALLPEL